jgi:AcrR family transcriptional regulator
MARPSDTKTARTDRRALLVSAASQLFSEHAYDEVTTTEIAKRAGVAYGLIAHHFTNKRGLYLATIQYAAEHLKNLQDSPPDGDTPAARLHNAIHRHIAYMDEHAAAFLALMRGGNGSDQEVRAIIDDLRWQGAKRILRGIGVHEPVTPLLRSTMRGWVGYLDELIIDHITYHDVPREHLVQLAVAALTTSLHTAHAIDPNIGISPAAIDKITSH